MLVSNYSNTTILTLKSKLLMLFTLGKHNNSNTAVLPPKPKLTNIVQNIRRKTRNLTDAEILNQLLIQPDIEHSVLYPKDLKDFPTSDKVN
jgi:hypothetical protein